MLPPGGAIGGWSAAFLHGVDTLDGYGVSPPCPQALRGSPYQPVVLCIPPTLHRSPASGITYVRSVLRSTDRTDRAGLTVTTPLRTAFDATRLASNLSEAVATLDACLFHRMVRAEELRRYVARGKHLLGTGLLRRALELADPTARNPWESRLRIFCTTAAGLPRPHVNRPAFNLQGGLLAIPDLLFEEAGCAVEFDGGGHRERQQHRRQRA